MGTTVAFKRPDGQIVHGYLAEPEHAAGASAIVVIQEWWGLNDQIRGVADRLACAGYIALVPDLFRGKSTVEAEEAHHLMTGLNFGDAASQDIRGAVQFLKTRSSKVGITGFCMGGTFTWGASASLPGLAAAVGYYGGGILGMKDLRPLAPTMLHFGEKDDHIPVAGVHEFEKLHPEAPVYIYPAGHGFHCDERASYDAPSAKLAWGRTMEFFGKHVG